MTAKFQVHFSHRLSAGAGSGYGWHGVRIEHAFDYIKDSARRGLLPGRRRRAWPRTSARLGRPRRGGRRTR